MTIKILYGTLLTASNLYKITILVISKTLKLNGQNSVEKAAINTINLTGDCELICAGESFLGQNYRKE